MNLGGDTTWFGFLFVCLFFLQYWGIKPDPHPSAGRQSSTEPNLPTSASLLFPLFKTRPKKHVLLCQKATGHTLAQHKRQERLEQGSRVGRGPALGREGQERTSGGQQLWGLETGVALRG